MKYIYSIIIPHYNSPHLLKRMLESIPEREDIQVVVVDDASTKENVEALNQLHHKNLELLLQQNNRGAGYARNVGLEHAIGQWVIVVDSDDVFAPDAFDVFDKYKDQNIDYLGFCIKCVDTEDLKFNGHKIVSDESVRKYLKNNSQHNLFLYKYKNTVCWNKLVSNDFLKKNDIKFEDCQVNNDVLYALLVGYYAESFKVISDELYYFAINSDSITHKKRTIEREFLFYLQAQKRNGFYKALGLTRYPFYRADYLYIPFMLKKRGVKDTLSFFTLIWHNRNQRREARNAYLRYIRNDYIRE